MYAIYSPSTRQYYCGRYRNLQKDVNKARTFTNKSAASNCLNSLRNNRSDYKVIKLNVYNPNINKWHVSDHIGPYLYIYDDNGKIPELPNFYCDAQQKTRDMLEYICEAVNFYKENRNG